MSRSAEQVLNKTVVLELFPFNNQTALCCAMLLVKKTSGVKWCSCLNVKKGVCFVTFLSESHFKYHLFCNVRLVHTFKTPVFSHGLRVQSWQTICSLQVSSSAVPKHVGFVILFCCGKRRTLQDFKGRTG